MKPVRQNFPMNRRWFRLRDIGTEYFQKESHPESCAGNRDHCGAVFPVTEMWDSEQACAEFSGGQRDGVWDVVCDRTDHFR